MTHSTTRRSQIVPRDNETYLAMVRGSIRSRIFQHFYATIDGRKSDLVKNGRLSCAFFVSTILHHFGWIHEPHLTVDGTVRDLQRSGWRSVRTVRAGDILIWEPIIERDGLEHRHIGFALGGDRAISNSSKRGVPVIHHMTFGTRNGHPTRRLLERYRRS